jgi:hypothetical protein
LPWNRQIKATFAASFHPYAPRDVTGRDSPNAK